MCLLIELCLCIYIFSITEQDSPSIDQDRPSIDQDRASIDQDTPTTEHPQDISTTDHDKNKDEDTTTATLPVSQQDQTSQVV